MRQSVQSLGILSIGIIGLVTVADACSAPPTFDQVKCDPKIASLADPWCLSAPDAGTDAAPDGASLQPEAACLGNGGECVPIPSDSNAYKWQGPAAVWFGAASEKPTECPFEGAIIGEKYAGLNAPPLDCAQCECEKATGNCAGVPDSISVGTAMCMMGGVSTPFDGPGGWDGACTEANAIPAGAQCPPGSGTPCVQSISWSALPGPQSETCAVKTNTIPKITDASISWEKAAVICESSLAEDLCNNGQKLCIPDVFWPWTQCVWLDGKHENECPQGYKFSSHVLYDDKPIDTRACTECSCGAPAGGECVANFSIFKDAACVTEIQNQTISSAMPDCDAIFPSGSAIGSKSITNHLYVPGTCAASGGEPIGSAVEDETKATTFCCRPGKIFEG